MQEVRTGMLSSFQAEREQASLLQGLPLCLYDVYGEEDLENGQDSNEFNEV